MHIVYLTHQFFPRHIGGVEVYTLGLAKHADAMGHQVTVITYHESASGDVNDFGSQQTSHEGLPIIEIHYNLSIAPRPMQYEYDNPYVANVLKDTLTELQPDLIHVMHAMKLSISVLPVCDELNIPFIVSLADFWFICPRHTLLKWDGSLCNGPIHSFSCIKCVQDLHGFLRFPYMIRDLPDLAVRNSTIRKTLKKAKRIIALSAFQKEMYVHNGIPARQIEVIQHGLDQAPVMLEAHEHKGPYCIGYIGSLVEHKGTHLLVEALAHIPNADVICEIYGAMAGTLYEKKLKQLAAKDSRVRFMGTFKPHEMVNVMQRFDVFAMPSLWFENGPLVIKSALRAGVPVICNDIGSLSEMVIPDKTGWLVQRRTAEAWAAMIQTVLGILPHFQMQPVSVKTFEENAKEIMQIYAEVTRG